MSSTVAVLGWEAMNAAERFAAIGGAAGLISVAVTVVIAWENRRSLKRQLDISAEANATAKLASEVTKLSVDDQLEMSRRARSAAVRIVEAGFCDGATARENGDLDAIPWFYDGDPGVDHPVMTLTLINEGMGSAYNIQLTPISVEQISLSSHHNFGWRMAKEGQSFHDAVEPYASRPTGTFLSLPPGNIAEFKVAVRYEVFRLALRGPFLEAAYLLGYEDGTGSHKKCFLFGSYLGSGRRAISRATEVPCPESPQV